jgi:hypothetical protein
VSGFFLYYLPKARRSITIDATGLDYAFDAPPAMSQTQAGPDGDPGLVLSRPETMRRVAYLPDEQAWQKIPGVDAWVGHYLDSVPGPADLARDLLLPGSMVTLGDGNPWQIPKVIGLADHEDGYAMVHFLPTSRRLDDSGKWVRGEPLSRYAEIWDTACEFWGLVVGAMEGAQDDDKAWSFEVETDNAVAVLATNYHISSAEVSMLRLLDDQDGQAVTNIFSAAVDLAESRKWIKKKLGSVMASDGSETPAPLAIGSTSDGR